MRALNVVLCALALVSVVAMGILAVRADAPMNFRAVLAGENEVPARETQARGAAVFQLRGSTLTFQLMVANIDNAFMAHIHCGAAGVNGPVRVFLFGPIAPGGGRLNGVIGEGSADISAITCPDGTPLFDNIVAGNTYVNVHTNDGVDGVNTGPGDFPGGEIRGQIF